MATPQWPGTFENYSRKFASHNFWKVRDIVDSPEDALQVCAMVFCRVAAHYHDKIPSAAWFMAKFKVALTNQFTSLARAQRCHRNVMQQAVEEARRTPVSTPPATALAAASPELRQVLQLLDRAPSPLLAMMLPEPQSHMTQDTEARISRSWCRLAGIAVREDLVSELRDLLAPTT